MTLTGLLTAAVNPYGAGAALTRAAATASDGVRPSTEVNTAACDCGQDTCPTCGTGKSDTVELSPEARQLLSPPGEQQQTDAADNAQDLTPEEQEQVDELKARDTEVRQHEQAHLAAAGQYAVSGPTYEYQRGPDGNRYAIGGEVQIDTAPVDGDPQATIQKMQTVRAAALAPAEPSGQDRAVAAKAAAELQKAQAELAARQAAGPDTDDRTSATANRPEADAPREPRDRAQRDRDPYQRRQQPVGDLLDAVA